MCLAGAFEPLCLTWSPGPLVTFHWKVEITLAKSPSKNRPCMVEWHIWYPFGEHGDKVEDERGRNGPFWKSKILVVLHLSDLLLLLFPETNIPFIKNFWNSQIWNWHWAKFKFGSKTSNPWSWTEFWPSQNVSSFQGHLTSSPDMLRWNSDFLLIVLHQRPWKFGLGGSGSLTAFHAFLFHYFAHSRHGKISHSTAITSSLSTTPFQWSSCTFRIHDLGPVARIKVTRTKNDY